MKISESIKFTGKRIEPNSESINTIIITYTVLRKIIYTVLYSK